MIYEETELEEVVEERSKVTHLLSLYLGRRRRSCLTYSRQLDCDNASSSSLCCSPKK